MTHGNYSKRDEHGWRIPREGTKSAIVYAMMREGKKRREITAVIGGNNGTTGVLMFKIKNPEKANKLTTEWKPGGSKYHGRGFGGGGNANGS